MGQLKKSLIRKKADRRYLAAAGAAVRGHPALYDYRAYVLSQDPHFRAVVDAIRAVEGKPHMKSKFVATVLNLGDI